MRIVSLGEPLSGSGLVLRRPRIVTLCEMCLMSLIAIHQLVNSLLLDIKIGSQAEGLLKNCHSKHRMCSEIEC